MSLPENDDDLLEVDIEKLSEEEKITFRDALISRWEARKDASTKATEDEYKIRDKVVDLLWTPGVLSGKERIPLYNGYRLEIEKGLSYKVDQQLVGFAVAKFAEGTAEDKVIGERLFRWKAEVSATEYKALSEAHKENVKGVIETVYSRASVKIVAPSTKGRAVAKPGAGI